MQAFQQELLWIIKSLLVAVQVINCGHILPVIMFQVNKMVINFQPTLGRGSFGIIGITPLYAQRSTVFAQVLRF